MLRRLVLTFAILALLASAAWTQTPVSERRIFAVSVLDSSGKPLEGLRVADFRGEYRGQPVTVLSVTPDTTPRHIAVVVDTSASMETRVTWSLGWDVALDLIHYLGPHSELAFFTVGMGLEKHVDFTRDDEGLREVFGEVSRNVYPRGGSALYDGLELATREFSPLNPGGVIYLISDVIDTGSSLSLAETEEALVRAGVRVFLVRLPSNKAALAPGLPRTRTRLEPVRGERAARRLTEATGGMKVELPRWLTDRVVLAQLVRKLYQPIDHSYQVEVEFPRSIDKRRQWTLEVVDAERKRRKDVQVLYPRLLVPGAE